MKFNEMTVTELYQSLENLKAGRIAINNQLNSLNDCEGRMFVISMAINIEREISSIIGCIYNKI